MEKAAQADYEPRDHWSRVGREIQKRAAGNEVAGDDSPFFRYKRAVFVREFLLDLPVAERSVLELGCGPGGNLAELTGRRPRRLAGVDIAPEMLQLAADRLGAAVDLAVVEPGGTLPFASREFDVAMTATVLQHNPPASFEATLTELCRVTGTELRLFEDVGAESRGNESYYPRATAAYVAVAERSGFVCTGTRTLPITVSARVCLSIAARFGHAVELEGAPLPTRQRRMERVALAATRLPDRWVTIPGLSLTEMRFRRRDDA